MTLRSEHALDMRVWSACLVIAVASCGGAQRTSQPVKVRLAHDNEFPARLASPLGPWEDCRTDGTNAPDLYRPVIAYAREQLLRGPATRSGYTLQRTEVRFDAAGSLGQQHKDGLFNEIVIDPKNKVGTLTVGQFEWSQGRSVWGASDEYCVHVVIENGTTVLVLALLRSIIG